ncbi:hypothetical protein HHK36_001086 [Tetracentron sinense]|uniref:Uncharacterized protein n=1 Tax=Tetracentron sinense TaxID=13715 RepID=A0A834ZX07_TETSI|nr:hypothetical protein HHK36_001086 [Tetracentron sinense]
MSHAKLRRQFEGLLRERGRKQRRGNGSLSDSGEVVSDSGKGGIPGFFLSRSPYENVLMSMGHAVHICRASSGEIIYCVDFEEDLSNLERDLMDSPSPLPPSSSLFPSSSVTPSSSVPIRRNPSRTSSMPS